MGKKKIRDELHSFCAVYTKWCIVKNSENKINRHFEHIDDKNDEQEVLNAYDKCEKIPN